MTINKHYMKFSSESNRYCHLAPQSKGPKVQAKVILIRSYDHIIILSTI